MRILCLDDEPLMLRMLQEAVESARPEAQISGFTKQKELIAEAENGGCDVAFLDIHMRGMTGVEVAKKLKEINPKMNIIFVTGFSDYKGDAMDLKASGYLMKPVTAEEVAAELEDLRFPIVPKKKALLFFHISATLPASREIAAVLFEDEPYDKKQQSYLQTLIAAMIKSLKKAGAESAVIKSHNALSVNTDMLDCDYYRFQELDAGAVNAYQNEYMVQYYWAEFF